MATTRVVNGETYRTFDPNANKNVANTQNLAGEELPLYQPQTATTGASTPTDTAVPNTTTNASTPSGTVASTSGVDYTKVPEYKSGATMGSEEAIVKGAGSSEEAQRQLAEYYNKNYGTNFTAEDMPKNRTESIQLFDKKQQEEKSKMDIEMEEAKAEALRKKQESQSATTAGMAQNREGVMSQGNTMTKDAVNLQFETQYNKSIRDIQNKIAEVKSVMAANQGKFLAGQEDFLRNELKTLNSQIQEQEKIQNDKRETSLKYLDALTKSGGLAGLTPDEIKYLEDGMPGVPPGIVQAMVRGATDKSMSDKGKDMMSNLKSFTDILQSGVSIPPSQIFTLSKQTGVPAEVLFNANEVAQSVMNDKTLDQATKAAKLQEINLKLDREARGITNAELEKVDYIRELRRSGASQSEIDRAMRIMGIDTDPMYEAELQKKQAEAVIEGKRSRGEPVTVDDIIKLNEATTNINDLSGGGSAVVPSKSLAGISIEYKNGKYNVKVPANTKMQCGEFVNRCDGFPAGDSRGVADSYKSKKDKVNNGGFKAANLTPEQALQQIKPGMNFVMPVPGKYAYAGHIGKVKSISADGKSITTIEANADGAESIQELVRPISQLYGFYTPDGAQTVGGAKRTQQMQENADVLNRSGINLMIPGMGDFKAEQMPGYEDAKKADWQDKPFDQRVFEVTNDPSIFNKKSTLYKELSAMSTENREAYLKTIMDKSETKIETAAEKEQYDKLKAKAQVFIKEGKSWDVIKKDLTDKFGASMAEKVMASVPKPK